MDLAAHVSMDDELERYVVEHYGEVPRIRGVRLMRFARPDPPVHDGYIGSREQAQRDMFARHVGEDVVLVHTRCGANGDDSDPCSNYVYCGGRDWEESNPDTFLESVDDLFDPTYRDHYFKAVDDSSYQELIRGFGDV